MSLGQARNRDVDERYQGEGQLAQTHPCNPAISLAHQTPMEGGVHSTGCGLEQGAFRALAARGN